MLEDIKNRLNYRVKSRLPISPANKQGILNIHLNHQCFSPKFNLKPMTNQDFFIASWQRDAAITAKAIRSLPNDKAKLNEQHHPNFRSPWEIVNHIAPHAREMAQGLSEGRMDLVNEGKFPLDGPNIYKDCEAAAKDLETNTAKLIELVKKCSDSDWTSKKVPVYWGAMKIMEFTMMEICWMFLFDSVHHRGQLSSYYRPIGVTQPNLMGPTLEEEMAMMAKQN
jgi:uncharacterized damage-inducible protein DinB